MKITNIKLLTLNLSINRHFAELLLLKMYYNSPFHGYLCSFALQ